MQGDAYTAAKVKVGFFSVLSLAIFVGFLFWVSGGRNTGFFAEPRQTVVVPFQDITGLRQNAPVTIAGEVVGEVVERNLDGKIAVVTMEIRRSIRLFANARFAILTPSLFGGAQITLDPGGPTEEESEVAVAVAVEDFVMGERRNVVRYDLTNSASETGMAELMKRGADTVSIVNDILAGFRADQVLMQAQLNRVMASSADLIETLSESVQRESIEQIVTNVRTLTEQVGELIAENRESLRDLTANLNRAVATSEEQIAARGEDVGQVLQAITRSLDDNIAPLLGQLERLTASLGRIAGDNEQVLYDSLLHVREATRNLEAFTARIRANPSLLVFGSGDAAADSTAGETTRVDRQLRDRGRMPLYDKRD